MTPIETAPIAGTTAFDVTTHPSLRWGAVIAGWVVAGSVALLLVLAGMALGFQMFDPYDATATAKGIGIGTAVWIVLTWVISMFLGGMFAAWFDGRDDQTVGAMHGITVWGLALAVGATLAAFGLSGAIAGGGAMLGNAAMASHGATNAPASATDSRMMMGSSDAIVRLQGHVASTVRGAPAASGSADQATVTSITTALLADHSDTASAVLAGNTGYSPADADRAVRGLAPQVTAAKAELKSAADKAAHYTAMAMWTMFISLLLAMIAAALGGWLGASHVHRVYHLRRYPRSTPIR